MFSFNLMALWSANSLGLRDRGWVENRPTYGFTPNTVHQTCCTRLRVGINIAGDAFIYCYRCEQIIAKSCGVIQTPQQRRYAEARAGTPVRQLTGPKPENVIELTRHKKPTVPPTAS